MAPGEVHLWRIALDAAPGGAADEGERLLGPDERARAARFRRPEDRRRFVAAHVALREILGGCLGLAPGRVRLVAGPGGKPRLPAGPLRFSLAHSGALALCAVARGREVGVDVERVRGDIDVAALARRFFSPPEVAELEALPAAERTGGFYRLWTLKEAYLKARGDGLALPLDTFSISLAGPRPVLLDAGRPAGSWSLATLEAGPGYAAALAVEGTGWRLVDEEGPPPPAARAP